MRGGDVGDRENKISDAHDRTLGERELDQKGLEEG